MLKRFNVGNNACFSVKHYFRYFITIQKLRIMKTLRLAFKAVDIVRQYEYPLNGLGALKCQLKRFKRCAVFAACLFKTWGLVAI